MAPPNRSPGDPRHTAAPAAPTTRKAPAARAAGDALRDHPTLADLLASHQRSHRLWQQALPALGPLATSGLRPGPIDDGTWTLMTDSPAVSAKARQLLPRVLQALQDHGEPVTAVKVKVVGAPAQ